MKITTDEQLIALERARVKVWTVYAHQGEDGRVQCTNVHFVKKGKAIRHMKYLRILPYGMLGKGTRLVVIKISLEGAAEELEAARLDYYNQEFPDDYLQRRLRMKQRGAARKRRKHETRTKTV